MRILLGLVVWLAPVCAVAGQDYRGSCPGEAARSLCAAETAVTEALRNNDGQRLDLIYDAEFSLINYRGRLLNRAAVLTALQSGALRFDSLTTSELQVRLYGETGVVTGRQHQVAREPGGDGRAHPAEVRFTHVYVLRGTRWRLVASQITPLLDVGGRRQ